MALKITNQYLYTGRGPFDAKSIVKTYNDLLSEKTWTSDSGNIIAYNGMIVAVWLNKDDATKNGIYYLYDSSVLTNQTAAYIVPAPDVTNPANWHKLVEIDDLTAKLTAIDKRLTALEEDSDVITYGYRKDFPSVGEVNKMYIAADEGKTYIWFNDDYLPVGGGDYEEPTMIYGGDSGI
jgi:hypothetical protein